MPHKLPTCPVLILGIAGWLRKACEVRQQVVMSPNQAGLIAELLEALARHDASSERAA